MPNPTPERQLCEEFNRWAGAGRGEEMEAHHLPIVLPMLPLIDFAPTDAVLDVGCGSGWLCRRLAALVPQGRVAGLDVSDEMVRRARRASAGFSRVTFLVAAVGRMPWPDACFAKVISVESAYYWPDPARSLREIHRILRPGGSLWILINLYLDNPYSHQWQREYTTPTHLLSACQWAGLFRAAGFRDVGHRRILDASPTPEVYSGRWFEDAEQWRRFKAEGALLVQGTKPSA